jgi:hypothetical protein
MYVAYTIRRNKYIASTAHPTREEAARELFTTLPKLLKCTTKHVWNHVGSTGDDVQWHHRADVFAPKKDSVEQTADALDAIKVKFGHLDTHRAMAAAQAIVGGRDLHEAAAVMVTLEHAVATVLIALYGDPHKAAGMLNEALVPGVERRLAFYGSKDKRDA